MKNLKLFAAAAATSMVLMISGCCAPNTIVSVNGESITRGQYETAFNNAAKNTMFTQMGIDLKKDQNSFLHLMMKDRVINELIVKKLLDQEVKKRHIKVTQQDLDSQLKVIIDNVGSKEKFNKLLKENGVTTAQFKKDLTDEVKIQKLVESLSVASVSDKDAKKFYDENADKFKRPDMVRASHILVSANPDEIKARLSAKEENKNISEADLDAAAKKEIAEKKAKADKLLAEAKKNPSDFAKLAKENSDDPGSAKQGGDLGFFAKEEMVEQFSKTAFSMKPNTISEVVQTPYGYHIILVTDRQKAGTEPFDKVKEEIKEFLTNQEKVKVLQQFVDTLKSNAKIEYKNDEFNPEKIHQKIREQKRRNPSLNDNQKSAQE